MGGGLLDQDPAGGGAECDVPALVGQDPAEALAQRRERVPHERRVDHDLVRGHRQHALGKRVVGGREPHEGGLDLGLVATRDRVHQQAAVPRQRLVQHVLDLEPAGRVDRRRAHQEVRRHLVGLEHADDPVVPQHEELGVLGLLHQERRQEHRPVVAAQRVGGGQHRHQLVGHRLLARPGSAPSPRAGRGAAPRRCAASRRHPGCSRGRFGFQTPRIAFSYLR